MVDRHGRIGTYDLGRCFECGDDFGVVQHHIVPRSKGGKRTVPLCQWCHDLVHGIDPRNISQSELTKAALARAKARGVTLGNPRIAHAQRLAVKVTRRKRTEFVAKLAPVLAEIRNAGVPTLKGMAQALNARGIKTSMGKAWTRQAVARMLS